MRARLKALCADHLPFMLVLPAYLWQMYFLAIPLALITGFSLFFKAPSAGWTLTLSHYASLMTPTYAGIIWNSAMLAIITATLCLLVAFPVAYYLAVKAGRWKNTLLVFLILPSWTSFIIQIYSWFFLLQKGGLFSRLFWMLGLTVQPVSFLNSYGATVLGMVYCFLPFMILPLYTVLEKMDNKLLEASADLGANRWQTFTNIVLPLSRSGMKVGMVLVMVPAFGEFAIPDLMGGFKDLYLGRVIMEKFLVFRDWHTGAAAVMLSFLIPLCIIGMLHVVQKVRAPWRLVKKEQAHE